MATSVADRSEGGRPPRRRKTISAVILAPIVAATAFIYCSYRRDMKAAMARVDSGSNLVSTACGPIERRSRSPLALAL